MSTKESHKQITTAIWKKTRDDLKLLAAFNKKSMVATVHCLVSDALKVKMADRS